MTRCPHCGERNSGGREMCRQCGGDLVLAAAADMTLEGTFGEEWLVVTKDRLLVFASNGAGPKPRLDVPLAEIRAPSTDSLVGGAALQATVNGEPVELVRYTNA